MELRFEPSLPPDAVFGLVYGVIREQYPNVSKLPILQVPDEIRERDPDLRFQPYYRLTGTQFLAQVGPRVVSVSATKYPGWNTFSNELMRVFKLLSDRSIFAATHRLALRYINFFDENIFTTFKMGLKIGPITLADQESFVRTQVVAKALSTNLQLTNRAIVGEGPQRRNGSAIDLDTFISEPKLAGDTTKEFRRLIDTIHDEAKRIFFSLLTEEFVASRNPVYEEDQKHAY